MLCDEEFLEDLDHTPLDVEIDITEYLTSSLHFANFYWRNEQDFLSWTLVLTEEGHCSRYNTLESTSIFRNETVDSAFLKQYNKFSEDLSPKLWSMEEGYQVGGIKNYPQRAFDIGPDNGLTAVVGFYVEEREYIDTFCRKNSLSYKVGLHHPADVAAKNYIQVPINKSVSIIIKPKITKTADSLRSYDPSV